MPTIAASPLPDHVAHVVARGSYEEMPPAGQQHAVHFIEACESFRTQAGVSQVWQRSWSVGTVSPLANSHATCEARAGSPFRLMCVYPPVEAAAVRIQHRPHSG